MLNKKKNVKRGTNVNKVLSIATDEAPAMLGRPNGLVSRLRANHPGLTKLMFCTP